MALTVNKYKSYTLSQDGKSWVRVFDGDSYDNLTDVPIKNVRSISEEAYICVSRLKPGDYKIHGFYKLDDDSELQYTADTEPFAISVRIDPVSNKKVAVFETVSENGIANKLYTFTTGHTVEEVHDIGVDDTAIPEINDSLSTIFSEISEMSEDINSCLDTHSGQIWDIQDNLADHDVSFSEVADSLSEHEEHLSEVDSSLAIHSEEIASIHSELAVDSTIISEINSTLDAHSEVMTSLSALDSTNIVQTSEIDSLETALGSQASRLDGRLDGHDSSISDINNDILNINSEFALLENTELTNGSIRQIAKSYTDALDGTLAAVAKTGAASNISVVTDQLNATNAASALVELKTKIDDAITASDVTVVLAQSPDQGDSSTYLVMQGGIVKSRIHIALDLVATRGELVDEDGNHNPGKFIKITIANGDPFYIAVSDLIDVYRGSGDVTQVTTGVEIKVLNGIISAEIKTIDGAKIDNGTVAFTKLTQAVQDKINLIDTAVFDIYEGSENGTIDVDGTNVSVHGLGSAAYTNSSAYDVAGAAATAKAEVMGDASTDTASSKTIEGVIKKADAIASDVSTLDSYVGTIPNGATSTNVVDYVSEVKDGVSGSATIASVSDNVVTLKGGVSQTHSGISNDSNAADIPLAPVAKTGKAENVTVDDTNNQFDATNVEGVLNELKSLLTALSSYVGTIPSGASSSDVVGLINETKAGISGSATIASKDASNNVTIKAGITQNSGSVGNSNGQDVVLNPVAVTGAAENVSVTDTGDNYDATNVETILAEIAQKLTAAINNSVKYNAMEIKSDTQKANARWSIDAVGMQQFDQSLGWTGRGTTGQVITKNQVGNLVWENILDLIDQQWGNEQPLLYFVD